MFGLGTAMATETYARKVVGDLLKPTTGAWLWRGHKSSTVRWLSWLLPRAFWVSRTKYRVMVMVVF